MSNITVKNRWQSLNSDLNRISRVENANAYFVRPMLATGIALAFIALAGLSSLVFFGQADGSLIVVAAAVYGAYIAINIGASWLGLPGSSTHIAVGAVFGVGFYREWFSDRHWKQSNRKRPVEERLARAENQRRKLVRRSHFMTIVAAWVITVPAAATMSAAIFVFLTAFV